VCVLNKNKPFFLVNELWDLSIGYWVFLKTDNFVQILNISDPAYYYWLPLPSLHVIIIIQTWLLDDSCCLVWPTSWYNNFGFLIPTWGTVAVRILLFSKIDCLLCISAIMWFWAWFYPYRSIQLLHLAQSRRRHWFHQATYIHFIWKFVLQKLLHWLGLGTSNSSMQGTAAFDCSIRVF